MTTFTTTQRSSHWLVILAALSFAVIATQASAASSDELGKSVKVSFADIDISTPAGAAVLDGRIKSAARQVCRPAPNTLELGRYGIWNNCYSTAISNAVANVGSPRLAALHAKSTGKSSLTASLTRR